MRCFTNSKDVFMVFGKFSSVGCFPFRSTKSRPGHGSTWLPAPRPLSGSPRRSLMRSSASGFSAASAMQAATKVGGPRSKHCTPWDENSFEFDLMGGRTIQEIITFVICAMWSSAYRDMFLNDLHVFDVWDKESDRESLLSSGVQSGSAFFSDLHYFDIQVRE